MGSSRWDIFRRVILPGTLPSIVVGSAVGMGITWEVVVAAEMISGGGSQAAGTGGGLGLLHLELVRRRLLRADRGRHDLDRHRRLSSRASSCARSGSYVTPWLRVAMSADAEPVRRRSTPARSSSGRLQELRRDAAPQGGRARLLVHDRARQAHGHGRPVGLRQEHADPPARRLRAADRAARSRSTARRSTEPEPRPAGGVPGDRAVPVDDDLRQHPLRAARARRADARDASTSAEFLLDQGRAAGLPQQVSRPALRRHAAPRRARARDDQQPAR